MRIHDQLCDCVRTGLGPPVHPSGAIIDVQMAKTTDKGGATALTARRISMVANAISSVRRRVSCGVSLSIPPI